MSVCCFAGRRLQTKCLNVTGVQACALPIYYYCPHHLDFTGDCECRKPKPGMLLKAAKDFDIDLKSSGMIGDRMSDLEAGIAAGCVFNGPVKIGRASVRERVCQSGYVSVCAGLVINKIYRL